MNYSQSNRPLTLNMDKSPKILSEQEAFYLLNHNRYLNGNGSGTLGKTTPLPANFPACEIEMPAGENYNVGRFYSKLTNEEFGFIFNSNGVSFISRINGEGLCEIVYSGSCLVLSEDPAHSIEQWRAYLRQEKVCANRHGKYLVWVDGTETPMGYIDYEASIATDFFSTPFFQRCPDPCAPLQLCVPQPCGCLKAEFVPPDPDDTGKTNYIVDQGFKFAFRHIYYDGRASAWSDRSSLYYQNSTGCFDKEAGLPRCLKLTGIPIGNPLVDKIEIAFSKNGGATWLLYDTVEKYEKYNSSQQKWYERGLSEALNGYDQENCTFDYNFCNDKLCQQIDPKEMSVLAIQIPREAQGLIPINRGIGVYNYKKGTCPLDHAEVKKFQVNERCVEVAERKAEYTTITVRAVIHNFEHNRNQFIYRNGGTAGGEDDLTDAAFFGGLNLAFGGGLEVGYDQMFNGDTRNFWVYVEGTDIAMQMKQKMAGPFFTNTRDGGIRNELSDMSERDRWRRFARHGNFFYQEAEIKVLKGTRGFLRLASHRATSGTGANQDTSTFVMGLLTNIYAYKGDGISAYDTTKEEIYFDTCNKDTLDAGTFLIQDNAADSGLSPSSTAFNGYVRDFDGYPIENALIYVDDVLFYPTDHNGFYHFYASSSGDSEVTIKVKGELGCVGDFGIIREVRVTGKKGANTEVDIVVGSLTDLNYTRKNYAIANMLVQDCSGQAIDGIRVAISGSKYATTGPDGIAIFRLRNNSTRSRQLTATVMNHSGCFSDDCAGGTNQCMPQSIAATPTCFNKDNPPVMLATAQLNKAPVVQSTAGLKSGGRYGWAIQAQGQCGRLSAAYEIKYIDIVKTQAKGKLAFCDFEYKGNGIVFPSWVDCMKILRTENLAPFELQWVIDKIERQDGKIKLTINSLNLYNEKYAFKTNTVYQWKQNDRIEFIRNGDGKIYVSSVHGNLNYQALSPFHDEILSGQTNAPADFFNQLLIYDDPKLSDLSIGAVIEMSRSRECETEPAYFEICASIPVVDGVLLNESGVFSTFDTYYVQRTIGNLPLQTFEHHSPSDFWGDHLTDTGRVHFVNKYENEKRYGRNLSVNSPNQFNYFGDLEKTFDAPEQGDLIAMNITEGKIILAIGEHDSFLAQTADEFLKVGSDGVVRALPADSIIGDAEPKISGMFGCQYQDIGSVLFGDAYALWVDKKGAYIFHDYNLAKDISEAKVQSFFRKRYQEKESANNSATVLLNHYRYATGINKQTGAVYLTLKTLRQDGVNNEHKPYLKGNDTIIYHPPSGDFLGFASFTAEGYSQLNLFDGVGCSFISYLNGVPYIHPVHTETYNEFYGVACDRVVGIAINKFPEKIKRPLALEIQDEVMWYVAEVTTEMAAFRSEIPPVKVKKTENKWNAAFLADINSRGGLYGDSGPVGYYTKVTLVRDNTIDLRYGTVNRAKRIIYDELDMIHFKFLASEQSGFTENI